jgi:ribosomal protein S18 acetylase RimI-like enzyme
MPQPPTTVRALRIEDKRGWRRLYRAYAKFYEVEDADLDIVWSWLIDPRHVLRGLIAIRDGRAVGLAHYRAVPRPLPGSVAGYLDDLFVEPAARGSGAADALMRALQHIAASHRWTEVRWITRSDNARARAFYDRYAEATDLITYHLRIE